MAWLYVSHRGSAQNKIDNTTISVNPTANLNVEAIIIIRCATDNAQSTDGSSSNHTVTDSKSNVWTKLIEWTKGGGGGKAGVTTSLWITRVKAQILTTDTITLTIYSPIIIITSKVIGVEEFSVSAGYTWAKKGSTGAVGTSATPSVTLSSLASTTHLFIGCVGVEGDNVETFTQDTDYGNNTSIGTTGGAAATNIYSRFGNRIVSLTSDIYDPTIGTSRDWVAILVALDEVLIQIISSVGDIASGENIPTNIIALIEPTYPPIKVMKCIGTSVGYEVETYSSGFLSTDSFNDIFNAALSNNLLNTSYSYEVWIRFQAKGIPRLTQFSNFKVWGSTSRPDAPGTKLKIMCGTTSTGITPSSVESTIAIHNMHTAYFSINTALSIGGTLTALGAKTNYLVMQLVVSTNSPKGFMPERAINFSYNET